MRELELCLEPPSLQLPRGVVVEEVEAGLTDGHHLRPTRRQLPDSVQVFLARLGHLMRVNTGGGPYPVVGGSEIDGGTGVFQIRRDGDEARHPGPAGPIDDGRPIFVEAAVRQMAVTIEHGLVPDTTLCGGRSPLVLPVATRRPVAEPLLDLQEGRCRHEDGRIRPDHDPQDED